MEWKWMARFQSLDLPSQRSVQPPLRTIRVLFCSGSVLGKNSKVVLGLYRGHGASEASQGSVAVSV
jgi:hypothetical protein